MRSDSDLHEPRTNAEQSETSDDLRVSYESRAPCRRFGYWQRQIQPNPRYSGVCENMTDEEAAALLDDLLDRFDLDYWSLPPTGLPGFPREGYDPYSPQAELIDLGVSYLIATIRNEPRAMHLRWREAGDFINAIEAGAEERVRLKEIRRQMDEAERRTSQEQSVYFIASQSGPIKIGIAADPNSRLSTLQTGHHERLGLLASCPGGQSQERAYHKQFAAHRLNGEWFERCPEIEAEIERLNYHVR
jgi:hypothetical protein